MSTVEVVESTVSIDATLISRDLELAPEAVLEAMRTGRLTAICEQGIEQDEGRLRATFYHADRRLRLIVDRAGQVLERSMARLRSRRRRHTPPNGSD